MRSTDEDYGSLAYDGALLLHVPLCINSAFLVILIVDVIVKALMYHRLRGSSALL